MAVVIPSHCQLFSRSPNRVKAPSRVKIGCVAFIGEAMVMGRCFREK